MYVKSYVPGGSPGGVNVEPVRCPVEFVATHVPPTSGVPPYKGNRSMEARSAQTVAVPFDPASGPWFTVAVTVAVALVHGATPVTV